MTETSVSLSDFVTPAAEQGQIVSESFFATPTGRVIRWIHDASDDTNDFSISATKTTYENYDFCNMARGPQLKFRKLSSKERAKFGL